MPETASEIARLRAELAASEAREDAAESEPAPARATVLTSEAMVQHLRLEIAWLRRERYGQCSKRLACLIDQLEEFGAAAATTAVQAFEWHRPPRQPFPEHLPREPVVVEGSTC